MKKSKHIVLAFVVFISCLYEINAQSNPVSSGGDATGAGGTLSYSIGQVVYTTATGSGGISNQGVQIPYEITTLGVENFPEISLQMVVYPNPTSSKAILKIENYAFQQLTYSLFDVHGKLIFNQKITNSDTPITMEHLASGTYLLKVTSQNKTLKTFKILKNNKL
ncbi:MAG: hypothetical protein CVU03_00360 [Bacteroidetes bacterium HGW-Bacteroidetes-2]|jgi:hypothetical protein|nr:MAG: hypothetical protein CVU03_00360 [Bacteroidetes bacterium HGW-Bacteroidetes-2]